MLGIWSDVVFAARVLRRSRGFTIIAPRHCTGDRCEYHDFFRRQTTLFDRLDALTHPR